MQTTCETISLSNALRYPCTNSVNDFNSTALQAKQVKKRKMTRNNTTSASATIVVLQIIALVLSFSLTTNCLSLEDRLEKLTQEFVIISINKVSLFLLFQNTLKISNVLFAYYIQIFNDKANDRAKMTEVLAAKDARLEELESKVKQLGELESKVTQLEGKVTRLEEKEMQELLIEKFKKEREIGSVIGDNSVGRSVFSPRTCGELRASDPSLNSGMHWIDPDGQGVGDDPIYVYCDMTTGIITFIIEFVYVSFL